MERVAVVTGGTGSLGRAVVRELLERGWRVHVPVRDDHGRGALEEAWAGSAGRAVTAVADLTDPGAVAAFFEEVGAAEGRLDAVCSLVGGWTGGRVEATEPADWDRMVALNATSAFLVARAAAPLLRGSGDGRLLNVAAAAALGRGSPRDAAYAASKAAVLSLTASLARDLGADGVRVNALAPTVLDTDANRRAMPDADRSAWVSPEAAARVVAFLLSDDGAPVHGSTLVLGRG